MADQFSEFNELYNSRSCFGNATAIMYLALRHPEKVPNKEEAMPYQNKSILYNLKQLSVIKETPRKGNLVRLIAVELLGEEVKENLEKDMIKEERERLNIQYQTIQGFLHQLRENEFNFELMSELESARKKLSYKLQQSNCPSKEEGKQLYDELGNVIKLHESAIKSNTRYLNNSLKSSLN
ncbi:MAG: hypothetical protein ACOYT4_01845 [Nanoarchaeota archaeon]